MRRKQPAMISTVRETLKQLCGTPTDGLVQVVDLIDITITENPGCHSTQQHTLAGQPHPQQLAVAIKIMWVPDHQGQLQPYQLLPSSCQARCGLDNDSSSSNLLLTQLIDMQEQQQQCSLPEHRCEHKDQPAINCDLPQVQQLHAQQQEAAAEVSQQQTRSTQVVSSSNAALQSAIAAASAAALAASSSGTTAYQRRCRHCAATHALSWVWYSHSKVRTNSSSGSCQPPYLLCNSCHEYLKNRGSQGQCKHMSSSKLGLPVSAEVAAAGLAAADKALAAATGSVKAQRVVAEAWAAGLRVCSNCCDCDVAQVSCGQSPGQKQQHQQHQQWLCNACRTYLKLTGNARPVCSTTAIAANVVRTAQLLAAWQGLLLHQGQEQVQQQQQAKQQQQQAKKRRLQDTAEIPPTVKKPAVGDGKPPRPLAPSNKQQQQRLQQTKSNGRVAAARSSSTFTGSTLDGSVPGNGNGSSKPNAAETAAVAKSKSSGGSSSNSGGLKGSGSSKPPKFKELKRNVFVFRQRAGVVGGFDESDAVVCECDPHKGQRCREEDGCLNRMCKVCCTPGCCPVGDDGCANMVLINRKFPASELCDLGAKGWGLLAAENIDKGTIVAEYTGEVIPVCEGRRRLSQYASEGLRHTYIMDLSNSEVIDATKKGGVARFINHSCEPNCRTEKWQVGREVVVAIVAIKAIAAGSELTYDYRYQSHALPHARTRCRCGAASCSGWLGSFDPHAHLQAELDEQEEHEMMGEGC